MTVNKDELRELIESDLFGDGAFSLDDLVTSEKKGDEAQEQFFETDLAIEPVDDDLLGAEIAALSDNLFKGLDPTPEVFPVDDFELPQEEPIASPKVEEDPLSEFDLGETFKPDIDESFSSDADDLIAEEEQGLELFFENIEKQLDSVEQEGFVDNEELLSQSEEEEVQDISENIPDPLPDADALIADEEQSLESFFESVEKRLDSVEQEVLVNDDDTATVDSDELADYSPEVDAVDFEEDQSLSSYFEEVNLPSDSRGPEDFDELTFESQPVIPPLPEQPPVTEGRVDVRPIEFPELEERISGQSFDLGFFANIPVKIDVYLGNTTISLKEVYDLTEGAIVSLDKLFGEPLDLRINGQVIAKGEVVAVDNQYGVMIKDIVRSNS